MRLDKAGRNQAPQDLVGHDKKFGFYWRVLSRRGKQSDCIPKRSLVV